MLDGKYHEEIKQLNQEFVNIRKINHQNNENTHSTWKFRKKFSFKRIF